MYKYIYISFTKGRSEYQFLSYQHESFPGAVPEGDVKSSSNSADKQTLSPRQLTCLHLLLQTLVNVTANNRKSDLTYFSSDFIWVSSQKTDSHILHVVQGAHAGIVSYLFHSHVYGWYIFSFLLLFLANFCLANVFLNAYQWTVTWETLTVGVFFACWRNRDWSQKSKDIFMAPGTLFYLTVIDAL